MAKIRKVIEEIEQDVERIVIRFFGHVRHDGKDYQPGQTAPIQADAAAKLIKLGAAEAAVPPAAAPADNAGADAAPVAPAGNAGADAAPVAPAGNANQGAE